jgi:hypothetical protein
MTTGALSLPVASLSLGTLQNLPTIALRAQLRVFSDVKHETPIPVLNHIDW